MTDTRATPAPFALAACLLFWGWQVQQLPLALALATLIESHRWVQWRWQLAERDFQRIADISSVLFVVLVFFQFNSDLIGGIYRVLKWLPIVLVPLLLAQQYGQTGGIPLSALFASVRRRRSAYDTPPGSIDLQPYFGLCCLVAASVGPEHSEVFAFVAMGLLAWLLMGRRLSGQGWRGAVKLAAPLAAATGVGLMIQTGLYTTQSWVEDAALRWMQDPFFTGASPDRAFTAIGMIGRLKLSDRILLRVATDRPLTEPLLLHEASYSEYRYASWRNTDSGLTAIDPQPDGHTWQLQPPGGTTRQATISVPLREDESVIPLPPSTRTLQSNDILGIQQNRHGAVIADARAGFVSYTVRYGDSHGFEAPPVDADRFVPPAYQSTLQSVAAEIGLPATASPPTAIDAVRQFFRERFEYSLVQPGRPTFAQPINSFLLKQRSGHCEYFATATVLLLRHLGIPARYAVGYSVSEYGWLDRQYIARQRDAHAWAIAFVDGRWQTVDTTPAEWRTREDADASAFSRVFDLSGWLSYQWSRWQVDDGNLRRRLPWLLPPLIGWLIWRLRGTRRAAQAAPLAVPDAPARRGLDSEFLAIVDALSTLGHTPRDGEPLDRWVDRLPATVAPFAQLRNLLDLHNRYRFDPAGLDHAERDQLRAGCIVVLDGVAKLG